MTRWRVFRLEWRRTGGPLLALGVGLTGLVLFAAKQRPLDQWGSWSSTFAEAVHWESQVGIVMGPVIAAAAAWVAGRERRRRIGELLASTPRPSWQRLLATSGAAAAALLVGWLGQAVVVLGAVFPTVSYWGGRWWASLLLVVLGMAFCSALGAAVGRLVPGRLVPPALGLLLYVGFAVPQYLDGARWVSFLPVASDVPAGTERLVAVALPAVVLWPAALVVVCGVVALGVRALWKVGAGAVVTAVVCVTVLLVLPPPLTVTDGYPRPASRAWIEDDPAATALVCTDDAPVVCVQRIHAGLLAQAAPVAREQLALVGRYLRVERAEEAAYDDEPVGGVLPLQSLGGLARPYRSGWDEQLARSWADNTVFGLTGDRCWQVKEPTPAESEIAARTGDTARVLLEQQPFAGDEAAAALAERLQTDPEQARAWMQAYVPAARSCDVPVLQQLAQW